MIPFNSPLITNQERLYLIELLQNNETFCGGGKFTTLVHEKLECLTETHKSLLTTSCTHAIEIASILIDIKEGDEVIMPSFTFVSTANPFVLRGAKIVFVDIRPDTMNIDENLIEAAITKKTKAIVPVHYAGVACEMDKIMEIANKFGIWVIEDAAQCIDAYYKGKHLGTIGHLGALSFHETKNIHCGEGGALLINHNNFIERAEIIREKGTNRAKFLKGQIDKYTWVDIGSSYLPSELNAAFLYAQLLSVKLITKKRVELWNEYNKQLNCLVKENVIEVASIPENCTPNGHIFYLKCKNTNQRQNLIRLLKTENIIASFHYIPLHSTNVGVMNGRFSGSDIFTTRDSERLLRLPLFYQLPIGSVEKITTQISNFLC